MSSARDTLLNYAKKQPTVVICGTATLLLVLAYVMRMGVDVELAAELEQKTADAAKYRSNIENRTSIEEQTAALAAVNANIAARLIRPTDVLGNSQYFYRLEEESGAKLVQFSRDDNRATEKLKAYSVVPYSVGVTGTWAQVMAFVRKLETGNRFGRIVQANVSIVPDDAGKLRVDMAVDLLGQL